MSAADFVYVLNKIRPYIAKQDTNMRTCMLIQERLAVTLRFLSTGDTFGSLAYLFQFSKATIAACIMEVCKALIQELQEEVRLPRTAEEWLKIEAEFDNRWNFPHCVGALDGKHILIQSPIRSGTKYFNFHGTFSMVLMSLVDANYNFTYVDIGCQGGISDGGIYRNSDLYKKIDERALDFSPDKPVPLKNDSLPYVIVAHSAFALTENMMKPYPGTHDKGTKERVFNYRLSRARRIAKNVFGIMSAVFRILGSSILMAPEKVSVIVVTCVLLHNFLRRSKNSKNMYTPHETWDGEISGEFQAGTWRNYQNGIMSPVLIRRLPRRATLAAKTVRDKFTEYFVTNGAVDWQDEY